MASKLLKRAVEIINSGDSLAVRLLQYRVYGVRCCIGHSYAPPTCACSRLIVRRCEGVCVIVQMRFPPALMHGMRSVSFATEVPDLLAIASAARL